MRNIDSNRIPDTILVYLFTASHTVSPPSLRILGTWPLKVALGHRGRSMQSQGECGGQGVEERHFPKEAVEEVLLPLVVFRDRHNEVTPL